MKKYYCLVLNNCLNTGRHYVSNGQKCTMLPNIITREVKDLSNIQDEFMELDDTITVNDDSYTVSCSFPVIGELRDGIMYDAITDRVIDDYFLNADNSTLSYLDKIPAYNEMAELLLSSLDEESIAKYARSLEKVATSAPKLHSDKNEYYFVILANAGKDAVKTIAEKTNGELVDTFTKEIITPKKDNSITRTLSVDAIKDIDAKTAKQYRRFVINNCIDDYYHTVREAKHNSIVKYNSFVGSTKYDSKPKLKVK